MPLGYAVRYGRALPYRLLKAAFVTGSSSNVPAVASSTGINTGRLPVTQLGHRGVIARTNVDMDGNPMQRHHAPIVKYPNQSVYCQAVRESLTGEEALPL